MCMTHCALCTLQTAPQYSTYCTQHSTLCTLHSVQNKLCSPDSVHSAHNTPCSAHMCSALCTPAYAACTPHTAQPAHCALCTLYTALQTAHSAQSTRRTLPTERHAKCTVREYAMCSVQCVQSAVCIRKLQVALCTLLIMHSAHGSLHVANSALCTPQGPMRQQLHPHCCCCSPVQWPISSLLKDIPLEVDIAHCVQIIFQRLFNQNQSHLQIWEIPSAYSDFHCEGLNWIFHILRTSFVTQYYLKHSNIFVALQVEFRVLTACDP